MIAGEGLRICILHDDRVVQHLQIPPIDIASAIVVAGLGPIVRTAIEYIGAGVRFNDPPEAIFGFIRRMP